MAYCKSCRADKETQDMFSPNKCNNCKKLYDKYNQDPEYKKHKAEMSKLWYHANKEQSKETSKKWRENNREKSRELARKYQSQNSTKPSHRLNKAKQKAKKRGIDFCLTLDEYCRLISDPCYYCKGKLGHVSKGVGLDRVDSFKGYVLSCCGVCNMIKGEFFTVEETLAAVKAILTYRLQQVQDHMPS